jgi:endonuclease/exonuclease/phosphatase family metal-dependent hydrolase
MVSGGVCAHDGSASQPSRVAEAPHTNTSHTLPARGASDTLDIASWNIEWFGAKGNGPVDKARQRDNAFEVIAGADMDIWGVAEIVSTADFAALTARLQGYSGLLANDPRVLDGAKYYNGFGNHEQKVGLLYKDAVASLIDAQIILGDHDYDFAGRPPLQVTLRVTLRGRREDIVVIVMHAKCCSDTRSWQRRQSAASALKTYLDTRFPTQKVWIIGDYNDDLDTSITVGQSSAYAAFLADRAHYAFPSASLTRSRLASTVDHPDTIDHHLVTDEADALYIPGSSEVYRADQYIEHYRTTTSDHYPVLSRYRWPSDAERAGASPATKRADAADVQRAAAAGRTDSAAASGMHTPKLSLNEVCANEPGDDPAGEFVELVNLGDAAVDLGGYTLEDGSSVRHMFSAGTALDAQRAIVVFGNRSGIRSGVPHALAASSGTLSLGNSGDSVTLRDRAGLVVQTMRYTAAQVAHDGVSLNRSPDGSEQGEFVQHTALPSAGSSGAFLRAPSSPGTRASGEAW